MVKNTKEEKQKAIDFYIRYCNQATKVIKELGYPNKRHTLVSWYRGYEEKGEVKDDGREEKAVEDLINDSRAEGRSEGIVEGRAEGEASAIFQTQEGRSNSERDCCREAQMHNRGIREEREPILLIRNYRGRENAS